MVLQFFTCTSVARFFIGRKRVLASMGRIDMHAMRIDIEDWCACIDRAGTKNLTNKRSTNSANKQSRMIMSGQHYPEESVVFRNQETQSFWIWMDYADAIISDVDAAGRTKDITPARHGNVISEDLDVSWEAQGCGGGHAGKWRRLKKGSWWGNSYRRKRFASS
jgi:hypothetical protein